MAIFRSIRSIPLGALFIAVLFQQSCTTPMIRKAPLEELSKTLANRTWTARKDIQAVYFGDNGPTPGAPVLFKKGTRLKVWISSKSDWLKLKAFPAENDREQARGRTIIYIFAEDIRRSLRKPPAAKKAEEKKTAGNDKDKQSGDGGGQLIVPAARIEKMALSHLQQKINELLE